VVGASPSPMAGTPSTPSWIGALGRVASAGGVGVAGLVMWTVAAGGGGCAAVGGRAVEGAKGAGVALRNSLPSLLKPLFLGGAWGGVGAFSAGSADCMVTTAYGAPGTWRQGDVQPS